MVSGDWGGLQVVVVAVWRRCTMWEEGTSPTCCGFSLQGCCWGRNRRVQPEVCLEARTDIRRQFVLPAWSHLPSFSLPPLLFFLFWAPYSLFLESLSCSTVLALANVGPTQNCDALFHLLVVVMVRYTVSALFAPVAFHHQCVTWVTKCTRHNDSPRWAVRWDACSLIKLYLIFCNIMKML